MVTVDNCRTTELEKCSQITVCILTYNNRETDLKKQTKKIQNNPQSEGAPGFEKNKRRKKERSTSIKSRWPPSVSAS